MAFFRFLCDRCLVSTTTKKLLKSALAVGLLALLIRLANPGQLVAALAELTTGAIVNLILISIVLIYISVVKWGLFLECIGSKISALRLFGLYLVGYFINLLMPSYLGGDVVRSFYAGKNVGQHEALSATILERYTGLVAMVALACVCMWFVELVTVEIKVAVLCVALGLVIITFLALSEHPLRFIERYEWLRPIAKHIRKIQEGFHLVRGNFPLLGKTFALSLLYHCCTVVNTIIAAEAVGWSSAPFWDLFVVLPVILLVSALPATPQGLGIQEGAFYFFLQGLGATPGQALGVAVVLRAKSYLLALSGGLVWLKMQREPGIGKA